MDSRSVRDSAAPAGARAPRPSWRRAGRTLSLSVVLILLAAILAGRPETPALAAPPPAISGLHASNNQILNALGQPVRLRGVNRTSGEYACIQNWGIFEGPVTDQAIQAMVSWHLTAVRIPLNEDCWLDVNTGGIDRSYVGTSYRNAVIDYVTRLTNAGLIVILDLHWAAPGTQQATGQIPMADRDHGPAFWTSVATTFKSNTAVIFDLFNEPYPDNNRDTPAAWECLLHGTTDAASCPFVGYEAAGMQELLNAVRATGATNLVMVAGVAYTGVLSQWIQYRPTDPGFPADRPNIAASVHIYPPGSQCSNVICWDQQLAPVAASYPLVAGEIGQSTCAHDRIDTVMDWLDSWQQHYIVWAWWREPCNAAAYYGLIADYLTGAPSVGYGQGYKDRLAGLSQQPTATPTRTPTPTATPGGTAPSYTTGASVSPSSVAPGGSVAITANVTSATAGTVVVDIEVHNPSGAKIWQAYYETETFAAGQTRSYPVTWPVPTGAGTGTYTVQIGIFSPGWESEYTWNSSAAQITVGAAATATPTRTPTPTPSNPPPPVVCVPRPPVQVTTRSLGGGQLEATVRAQTPASSPPNGLTRIVFSSVERGSVSLSGTTVAPGTPVPLGSSPGVTFILTRQPASPTDTRATMAYFIVRDGCGDWISFVGGGPGAFAP
jgi:hypothetical protein